MNLSCNFKSTVILAKAYLVKLLILERYSLALFQLTQTGVATKSNFHIGTHNMPYKQNILKEMGLLKLVCVILLLGFVAWRCQADLFVPVASFVSIIEVVVLNLAFIFIYLLFTFILFFVLFSFLFEF